MPKKKIKNTFKQFEISKYTWEKKIKINQSLQQRQDIQYTYSNW